MRRPLSIHAARAAALFVDLQEEHRHDTRYLAEGFDAVLTNAARLQAAARAAGIPVFHAAYVVDQAAIGRRRFHPVLTDGRSAFSDSGDPLTALCPEVAPADGEEVLIKTQPSMFGDGRLTARLSEVGVEWLFVSGVWTEACVDATVKDALALGLRVILVKDACGSGSTAMHQTGILNLANRLYGGAVASTADAARLMAGETVDVWQVQGAVPLRFSYANAAELYASL